MTVRRAAPDRRLQAVEVVLYAVAYAAAAFVVVAVPSFAAAFALGDPRIGWLFVHVLLFVGGFTVMGYAAFKLRPSAPHKLARDHRERAPATAGDTPAADGDDEETAAHEAAAANPTTGTVRTTETRLEAAVARLPPLRNRRLLPDDRIDPHAKQLLAAVLLLVVSAAIYPLFVA